MKLQTQIPLAKQSHNLIDYKSKVFLVGSCFVENIGEKLDYFKFQNTINPFGILFHPIAIENLFTRAINEDLYTEENIFFYNEQWHCFDAHSQISIASKEELLTNLNDAIKLTNNKINKSTHIVITLGTSWVYRNIESGKIVANCHKIPQNKFQKELLSISEISKSLNAINSRIKSVNPKASVLFTVSPVRHLKDGFQENQRSKAHLISAIHQIVDSENMVHYFPSYEIMMDELRDYRFYKEDMIHPNQLAVNYIWNKFKGVWMSSENTSVMKEVDEIQKGLAHRPFNPKSEQYQKFIENLKAKISNLNEQYPQIEF